MKNITAILSMLHEPPTRNSATRLFRNAPVLKWTLERLSRSAELGQSLIICWDDQVEAITKAAGDEQAVLVKGPRQPLPHLDAITAARRWSDGWRGGLLSTCEFDRGFHAPFVREAMEELRADAVVLIDPAAGLVDAELVDGVIRHAIEHDDIEISFTPAAPGLAGVLMRRGLMDRLAAATQHPGRLMHYLPDQISREPLAMEWCAPVPMPVARTTNRFTLDTDRQIDRMTGAMECLNGQLISSGAEDLVRRAGIYKNDHPLPRDVVLELNTTRSTKPIFWPGRYEQIERQALDPAAIAATLNELGQLDDTRLTLAGVGDPLLAGDVLFDVIHLASQASIQAIHVETDLLEVTQEQIARLARAPIDVVSIHIPAMTPRTYAQVMGTDESAFARVLDNLRLLVTHRLSARGKLPIVVPTFTKLAINLGEMEQWYDQWLRAVGSAVIRGPGTFGGIVPADIGVDGMTPLQHRPRAGAQSRLTILSTGFAVACEEDITGRQVLGNVFDDSLGNICRAWHRP